MARGEIADETGAFMAAQGGGDNETEAFAQLSLYRQRCARRCLAAAVGTGGDQRVAELAAQGSGQRVAGDAHGEGVVAAAQPAGCLLAGRQQPGDGAGPGGAHGGFVCCAQREKEGS